MPKVTESSELLDSAFLTRLKTLSLKARKRRRLIRRADQVSKNLGSSKEFRDHRSYVPGDDLRHLDWNLYARLDRPFIRRYEETQEFHVHILIDKSLSMLSPFESKGLSALRCAAALAWVALEGHHRVTLYEIGEHLERSAPSCRGIGHMLSLMKHLGDIEFEQSPHLVQSLQGFQPEGGRRSMCFLISDLYGSNIEDAQKVIRQLKSWPSETRLLHIYSPEEENPLERGELSLLDIETGLSRRVHFTQTEYQRYIETYKQWLENIKRDCHRSNVDYFRWDSERDFEQEMIELLSRDEQFGAI